MTSLVELEPAFEHLLRDVGLDESTIWALRHCRINDRETFTGLADSPEELRTIASDLGINLADGGMPHKREYSKVLMAWKRTKAQVEVKTSTEALQRQHGEPVRMLPEDWTSVIVKFKSKYGTNLQEEELPAQAYFEEFQEKLAAGMLQAEPLDQVISQAEAEEQDRKKPDPPRQYGMHLNATLTIQTRRRYTSSLPKNLEELRQKYDVLSNCWLLGQQRQPGRALYSDVDSNTFPRILKELLGKKNFALKKELEGKPLVAPPWAHCLSYEYELRREAYKRCREQSVGFNAAWWGTYADTEHRMLHWLQLVSLANSVPQAPQQSISSLVQKEVAAQLKRNSSDRSRTPRFKGSGKGQKQLPAPQQLALPGPAASSSTSSSASKGNGKGNGRRQNKRHNKRPPAGKVWTMRDLLRGGPEVQNMLHGNKGNGICFAFQDGLCENSSCARQHVCIGCGGNRGYNQCQCLQSKLAALA